MADDNQAEVRFYFELDPEDRCVLRPDQIAEEEVNLAADINYGRRLLHAAWEVLADRPRAVPLVPIEPRPEGELEDVYMDAIWWLPQAAEYEGLSAPELCERAIASQRRQTEEARRWAWEKRGR